ncbi:MAG: hypothetical protein E6I38_07175 [Chloroflexi bacterium]|nr:MAG: hypothetical protein E6I38_07175 [Chloroflexota bacterium]
MDEIDEEFLMHMADVDFREARELADLASIAQDLGFVIEVLNRLVELLESDSEDRILVQSYWSAALVAYIRCFSAGKRLGLDETIFEGWDGAIEGHRFYKDLRDKHIAHSVNPFEQVVVGLALSSPASGRRQVEGVAMLSQKLISQEADGVRELDRLAKFARRKVVVRAKECENEVLQIGKTMPTEDLYSRVSLRTVAPGPEEAATPRN